MYTFDLSDGTEIVLVTAFAEPLCRSGTATVEGTYRAAKGRVNASYSWKEIPPTK
jgi:hypothetical protein